MPRFLIKNAETNLVGLIRQSFLLNSNPLGDEDIASIG